MQKSENEQLSVTEQITRYISDHVDNVTLGELSKQFSYHPNYISALIHKETGKTFKQLVLEERMSRAVILMKNTTLSNEEIAVMLGYSDQSNFYKAFREFYGVSPREYEITDQ
ncbi:MAG: helix-turn-helix transcriptional regulator [Ruminococcus sp.]|nr:helix-turn-helix transcriptional regulator [Ruminococcus sp.]